MPRSVETSKMTAWVGMCSPMFLSSTVIVSSPIRAASRSRGAVAERAPVLERQAEVLGEARLAGAEEAGDPDADALVRLVGRLRVALEDRAEVGADRVGGDVLGELVADELLVGLVDLDDLLDVRARCRWRRGL